MLISLKIPLFSISFLLGSIFLSSLEITKNFIKSKPPGRRLVIEYLTKDFVSKHKNACQVTSDIHIHQATCLQLLLMVFMISNMIRAVWDSFSYWYTFAIIHSHFFSMGKTYLFLPFLGIHKIFLVFWVSMANFSAFLQVAFMFDFG